MTSVELIVWSLIIIAWYLEFKYVLIPAARIHWMAWQLKRTLRKPGFDVQYYKGRKVTQITSAPAIEDIPESFIVFEDDDTERDIVQTQA